MGPMLARIRVKVTEGPRKTGSEVEPHKLNSFVYPKANVASDLPHIFVTSDPDNSFGRSSWPCCLFNFHSLAPYGVWVPIFGADRYD